MTSNEAGNRSLTDIFGNLQLSGTDSSGAQQEDPCKMPQSDPNGNCDDARDNSSIIVVDSDEPTVVSFIDPDDLISLHSSSVEDPSDSVLAITIDETESEASDVHGRPGPPTDSATSGANMDTTNSSKPIRSILKRSSYSLTDDDGQSKKRKLDAHPEAPRPGLKRKISFSSGKNIAATKSMEEMAASSSSSPKVVTRSGRAVRMRLDMKFDYSASQPDDDDTQDSLNLSELDSDDEEYQLSANNDEPNWSKCKRRRFSHESNHTSTSTVSSSMEAALIYLDLDPAVAIIKHSPFDNLDLNDDADLKTKILKFLNLIPRRRKLYNPEDHLHPDEPPHMEAAPSRSSLLNTSTSTQLTQVPPSPLGLNTSLRLPFINVCTIDTDTPEYIRAPIDLTELPSEKWRANNCRRHKGCIACLEQHPHLYSFIDSLHRAASIRLCHPQALSYRKKDFESRKQALAKLLFNMYNHAIFHCALEPNILWTGSAARPCSCEMTIDSSGRRSARILLWKGINHPDRLIRPLLHEMCHAAAFVINRETGHGEACRQWAYQANQRMTELTTIYVCDARFKYICTMCGRGSYGLIDLTAVKELLRCHYCQFEVVVEPWSRECVYDGILPDTTMTEFKTFIYNKYQLMTEEESGRSHNTKMSLLNQQYLKMKAACD